jgi:hypothetical protein
VSFADWYFGAGDAQGTGPLGDLAFMVLHGARVVASPRAPEAADEMRNVVLQMGEAGDGVTLASMTTDGGGAAGELHPGDMSDDQLREALFLRIPEGKRASTFATTLVEELMRRRKIFGRIEYAETTELVDMRIIGHAKPVSFKVPIRRGAQGDAATEGLNGWIARGAAEMMPWDTPSYGFAIVVPKAGGKWRVTINPTETNRVTERVDPEGGYMADNMVREAQRAGRGCRFGAGLDYAEAFTCLKLTGRASEISTFTTLIGKVRFKQGSFGWHSFPAVFQRFMMEKVVLPTVDELPSATILGGSTFSSAGRFLSVPRGAYGRDRQGTDARAEALSAKVHLSRRRL